MSESNSLQAPSGRPQPQPPITSLYKQKSWSPDMLREEAWLRRKDNNERRTKSVTDEDLDELKGCIELGFGFDSHEVVDPRVMNALPALELLYAVNKQYNGNSSKSRGSSECETPSPVGSPLTIFGPAGDNPQEMKTRLKQWAQVVACSVRQCSK